MCKSRYHVLYCTYTIVCLPETEYVKIAIYYTVYIILKVNNLNSGYLKTSLTINRNNSIIKSISVSNPFVQV